MNHHPQQPSATGELPLKAALFTVFLCMLFGANAVAIKVSLTGIGVFTAISLRFIIAASVLLLYSRYRGLSLCITKKQLKQVSLISLIFFFQISLFYLGQSKTSASHGTLIANILPFIVMVLAHFFLENDRIKTKTTLGLLIGFSGVLVLLTDSNDTGGQSLTGDLIILSAVFLWGFNVTYIKRIISGYLPLQITLFPMLLTIPLFIIMAALCDDQPIHLLNAEVVAAVLYQSLVTAAFGFVMWNSLIQKYGASTLHSFVFIMPVSGVFLGVMLLGETLSVNLGGAILLVMTGLIIVNIRQKKRIPQHF